MASLDSEDDYHGVVPKLSLYHYPSCFYCRSVRQAIEKFGLDVELRDIHQDRNYQKELFDVRGRGTVPVLRIEEADGSVQFMGESRDIIEHLATLAAGA